MKLIERLAMKNPSTLPRFLNEDLNKEFLLNYLLNLAEKKIQSTQIPKPTTTKK